MPPTRATPGPSWPVVGSSRTSTAGSMARMLPRATSLRPETSRSYGLVDRARSSGRWPRVPGRRAARPRVCASPRLPGPKRSSRSTVREKSWSSGSWKTKPTCDQPGGGWARRRCRVHRASTVPDAGRSSPTRCLTSVVLPEPFCPTMATRSPGSMDSETPRTASTMSYRWTSPETSMVGISRPELAPRPTPCVDGRRPVASACPGAAGGLDSSRPTPAPSAAADRAFVEGLRRRDARAPRPGARSSVPRCPSGPSVWRPQRGAGDVDGNGPAAGQDEAAVHAAEHGRIVLGAHDGAAARRQLVEHARRPPACRPGRAAPVGSSSTSTSVPMATMLAMATRCCSPPESANGSRSARRADAELSTGPRRSARPSRPAARPGSRGRTRAPRAPSASMPRAGWPASRRRCPHAPARLGPPDSGLCLDHRRSSRPSTFARTTRGTNPAATSASVDLPAPVRPATPSRSPAPTVNESVGEARLPAPGIADLDGVELKTRWVAHRPSPRTTAATTRHRRQQDGDAQPAIDWRVGRPVGRTSVRPRPEAAGLEGEGPLADVDERAEDDRPDERHKRSQPSDDRARDRQAACLLGLQDGTRSRLHAGHHLDDREDHERQSMADPTSDQRLEDVVGQGREEEEDGGQEDDQETTGRDDPEGDALPGHGCRPELDDDVPSAGEEERVDEDDRHEQERAGCAARRASA